MRTIRNITRLLAAVLTSALLASCGEDFQGDIDKLNDQYSSLDQRVTKIESQVNSLNTQLGQLSALASAVEQNFYVTQVRTTADGYELTMSNGSVITLQNGTGNTLTPVPAVSMTQISGLYFWTLDGLLLTGSDGLPLRTSAKAPVVRYDYTSQQWLISVDGGITFQDINANTSIVINDEVLLQVINNYVASHAEVAISQQVIYQIISTYIREHYAELFNVNLLNQVVTNHVQQYYTRIFNYELMEQIFTQYNFQYITSQIKVDELVSVIVGFIRDNRNIFLDNDVLYEIIASYLTVNKTTIFTEELLLEVINNFVANNENFIDVDLLTRVVHNYLDTHQDVVFNTEVVRNFLLEYVSRYYTQVFTQDILQQVVNTYVVRNYTTIFSETLIREVISNYVQNNYTAIFTQENIQEIVNTYLRLNTTTFINREVLVEVITAYFERNYNLFIDKTVITETVNTWLTKHQTTIIDVDIVSRIVSSYMETYFAEVFTYDMLSLVVRNYFETNLHVIGQHIFEGTDIIRSVQVSDDLCTITLSNGQTVRLVVYDAYARLKNRVQSLVAMPGSNGHFSESGDPAQPGGTLNLTYLVAPASMAQVIMNQYTHGEVALELRGTDDHSNLTTLSVSQVTADNSTAGVLHVTARTATYGSVKTVALHVRETRAAGTDIMTEFTPVDAAPVRRTYLRCPDDQHPHLIDLGLPSGTLWSCCNVEASKPEEFGGYYAWGETVAKDYFSRSTYDYVTAITAINYTNIGDDIAGSQYDVARVKWGGEWQMPTKSQFEELTQNTTSTWTTINGVGGRRFTGSNGGYIFFPAAGVYFNNNNISIGSYGSYWSSTIYHEYEGSIANVLYFYQNNAFVGGADSGLREYGNPVRPVAR